VIAQRFFSLASFRKPPAALAIGNELAGKNRIAEWNGEIQRLFPL
jgi:hypothetical protein